MYDIYEKSIQKEVIPHMEEVCKTKQTWKGKLHFPVGALVQEAEKAGFTVHQDDMSTNGWQWDWWIDMEKDGERYTLGGSGYYGGIRFFVAEE